MKMKKILALVLAFALTITATIGGTVAYLTKELDSKENVFAVGDINVTLTEDVAVIGEGCEIENNENEKDEVIGAKYTKIMPGDYLKKEVTVANKGETPAYVAVTVKLNNALAINKAIDEFYGDDKAQEVYDNVFIGWGLNHSKDLDNDGKNDAGMRLTITGEDMPEHVLQVDSVKTIDEYALFYTGNWYGNQQDIIPFDDYYTSDMDKYELKYTYYVYLQKGESTTLFNGLNVPAEFNANQLAMFDGLVIDVEAKAIQADNMGVAAIYADDEEFGEAKTAFAVLNGVIKAEDLDVNNAPVAVDTWDGTADTTWYNDTDTEFTLKTAEQFAGLAELVDDGNTFEGKTIKLATDIDLYCEDEDGERMTFDPIGDESPFAGTFDGQGHTIENLYQNGWALDYDWYSYGSIGLFGELENATVKNLTISGAESLVEGGDVGGITGSATGDCVFENITIEDSVFATYNNGNGGIIGWSGAGNYTFKNITIAEDVVLAGLWGSFDSSIGGVVGQGEPGATYNFENVDIACRLDVYNDCTASYDYYNYRMCGMIIGRLQKTTTIDGTNYPDTSQYNITCNDVTVTYGDWANYHYCEPTPGYNNGRGMRVEPGYAYDGLPADFDHTQCVDNHMNLIPFDQIFGGAQLGVKGLKTYEGVTVVYNNK